MTATGEIWFLTGSQDLYGPETLEQVASQSQGIAAQLGAAVEPLASVVWKPVLTNSFGDPSRVSRCEQR